MRFARKDAPVVSTARTVPRRTEPRLLGWQTREPYEALQAARQQQTTEAFQRQYAARAGVESTHEQAIRRCGLRLSIPVEIWLLRALDEAGRCVPSLDWYPLSDQSEGGYRCCANPCVLLLPPGGSVGWRQSRIESSYPEHPCARWWRVQSVAPTADVSIVATSAGPGICRGVGGRCHESYTPAGASVTILPAHGGCLWSRSRRCWRAMPGRPSAGDRSCWNWPIAPVRRWPRGSLAGWAM